MTPPPTTAAPGDDDDTLAAWALDALEVGALGAVDAALAADPHRAAAAARYRAVAGHLAASLGADDAAGRGVPIERLLAGAADRRAPGASLLRVEPIEPAEAHRRQWTELAALLDELTADEWRAVTSMDVTVHELVAHLVAQHRWIARALFRAGHFVAPPGTEGDHWGLSWPTIERLRVEPPSAAVAELAAAVGLVVDVAAATAPERWARGAVPLTDAFAARTFELWIHTDDIRRSTGRPMVAPDRARLDRLCRLAASFAPLGMEVVGTAVPGRTMRLVLTGPGGGTWVQPLGLPAAAAPPGAAADVTIVADGARFCRVAGKLLAADELDAHVEGDAVLADAVVAGARAFAE